MIDWDAPIREIETGIPLKAQLIVPGTYKVSYKQGKPLSYFVNEHGYDCVSNRLAVENTYTRESVPHQLDALYESIKHWRKMRLWAINYSITNKAWEQLPVFTAMEDSLKERPNSTHCALCRLNTLLCEQCILNDRIGKCAPGQINLYASTIMSSTWKQFISRSTNYIEQLLRVGREVEIQYGLPKSPRFSPEPTPIPNSSDSDMTATQVIDTHGRRIPVDETSFQLMRENTVLRKTVDSLEQRIKYLEDILKQKEHHNTFLSNKLYNVRKALEERE